MTWGDGEGPELRFADARGARIAYQDFGRADGPVVVAIPPLAQNLEMAFEVGIKRAMFERFAGFSRWIQFDKRGTGCSDRRVGVPGMDERVDDLRAVMDAAGVERAHLFGQSEGGPTAILFAVTYPARVLSLTLFGSGPTSMRRLEGDDEVARKERMDQMVEDWGTPASMVLPAFAPSMGGDDEFRRWWDRYERNCADRDALRELLEMNLEADVSEVLGEVTVPTLVVHRVDDPIVPVELGREAAAGIPGARLVELPGHDHFGFAGDMDAWVDEVERFVTGSVAPREPRPVPTSTAIVTLGRFAVVRDGVEVPTSEWGSRRARTLCKRLAAARGWPVTRDELIDLLWPDEADLSRLSGRLSVLLSTVRRVLGGGVVADRATVALDLDEVQLDLAALHDATDDGDVLALYGGEFLPEDRYDGWTDGPRQGARRRFADAARRSVVASLDGGEADAAVDVAARLVDADRFDTDAHELLVRASLAAGRPAEARRAHAVWTDVAAELGVDVPPMDALVSTDTV